MHVDPEWELERERERRRRRFVRWVIAAAVVLLAVVFLFLIGVRYPAFE